MTVKELVGAIEAILFASGEPVLTERLTQVLNIEEKELLFVTQQLEEKYSDDSGIKLVRLENSLQFCSNPRYINSVRELMDLRKNVPLSAAAMEVLAVVSYNQPVTKAFVEQVRGVDCSGVVSSLIQKGLIAEVGRLELPGRPLLYATTNNFLRCFGLSSLSMLPEIHIDVNDGDKELSEEVKEETDEVEQVNLNEAVQETEQEIQGNSEE